METSAWTQTLQRAHEMLSAWLLRSVSSFLLLTSVGHMRHNVVEEKFEEESWNKMCEDLRLFSLFLPLSLSLSLVSFFVSYFLSSLCFLKCNVPVSLLLLNPLLLAAFSHSLISVISSPSVLLSFLSLLSTVSCFPCNYLHFLHLLYLFEYIHLVSLSFHLH